MWGRLFASHLHCSPLHLSLTISSIPTCYLLYFVHSILSAWLINISDSAHVFYCAKFQCHRFYMVRSIYFHRIEFPPLIHPDLSGRFNQNNTYQHQINEPRKSTTTTKKTTRRRQEVKWHCIHLQVIHSECNCFFSPSFCSSGWTKWRIYSLCSRTFNVY